MADKVTNFQDLGKLKGVAKVVEATEKAQATRAEDAAAAIVSAVFPDGGEQGDLNALLNFKPAEFVREGKRTAAILEDEVKSAEELVGKIASAKETLRKIRETNRRKGILGNTAETRQLEAMIAAGAKAFDALDEEVKNLYRFRRDHGVLASLVDLGHKLFKALKKGEKPSDETMKELTGGYADFLHDLLREGRIVEVSPDQLKKWAAAHVSFTEHACSWVYKDCRSCPNGRCRTHWFWGVGGDEQSVRLARDLRNLNNINSLIRNFGKNPKPAGKPAPQPAEPIITADLAATVPSEHEGSTPVEPEIGPTES